MEQILHQILFLSFPARFLCLRLFPFTISNHVEILPRVVDDHSGLAVMLLRLDKTWYTILDVLMYTNFIILIIIISNLVISISNIWKQFVFCSVYNSKMFYINVQILNQHTVVGIKHEMPRWKFKAFLIFHTLSVLIMKGFRVPHDIKEM